MQLANEGASVVVADMDASGAERVARAIGQMGDKASSCEINVADPIEVEAMVAFAERTYGVLHLAVNNAGISGPSAPTGDYPIDGWQKVIDVNCDRSQWTGSSPLRTRDAVSPWVISETVAEN